MKKLGSLFILLIVLAVSGCSAVPVDKTQSISTPVTDEIKESLNAAVIIFLRKAAYGKGIRPISDEQRIVTCIMNRILVHNPNQNIISFNKVASKLFPDLPEKRYPRTPDDYSILLNDKKFYTDISSLGIRHVIFVGGATTEINKYSGGQCIPTPGFFGYGCSVWFVWDDETRLLASILDIHLKTSISKDLENNSTGTSWFALIGGVPIGMPSFTVHKACSKVGNYIGEILLDEAKYNASIKK